LFLFFRPFVFSFFHNPVFPLWNAWFVVQAFDWMARRSAKEAADARETKMAAIEAKAAKLWKSGSVHQW